MGKENEEYWINLIKKSAHDRNIIWKDYDIKIVSITEKEIVFGVINLSFGRFHTSKEFLRKYI